jgi:hypothetical protein
VRVTGSGLTPGANTLEIGDQPTQTTYATLATVTVAADGTLDTTVTVPGQTQNIYPIRVHANDLHYGLGYFSVPCPTAAVQPTCGPADDGSGAHYALGVSGTGYGPPPTAPGAAPPTYPLGGAFLPVHIELDGVEVPGSPTKVNPDGTFTALVTPARVKPGVHTIHTYQTTADAVRPPTVVRFRNVYVPFTVPCATTTTTTTQTTVTKTTTPTTAPTTPTTAPTTPTKTTTTTTTTPTGPVTLTLSPTCLETNAAGSARVQVAGTGFAPGSLDVLVDGAVATKAAASGDGSFSAEVDLAAGTDDHAIEAQQGSRRADATLSVPCASHPKLQVAPALGPPGFVTQASGSGFPPNVQVALSWAPGIGNWTVRTDAKGAFQTSVFVFPNDRTGVRQLRAAPVSKGRFGTVSATFLCVPGTLQPRDFEARG